MRPIRSGPRSRRTTLPPSGSGRPVSSFHQRPRSTTSVRPSSPNVSCPSWIRSPASNSPARTASWIRSNGIGRVATPGAQSRSASAAVVHSPGDATGICPDAIRSRAIGPRATTTGP